MATEIEWSDVVEEDWNCASEEGLGGRRSEIGFEVIEDDDSRDWFLLETPYTGVGDREGERDI